MHISRLTALLPSLSLLPLLILALPAPFPVGATPSAHELDTKLTPDNFESTIAKGLWFVEHYSPWCGHCKHFKPTWKQLVVDAHEGRAEGTGEGGEEMKEVKMGSVDCSVHGDLCDQNNIKGYPTLLMFHDGKVVDQFKGPRELADLKTFITRHAKAAVDAAAPPPPPPPPPAPPAAAEVKPSQPKQHPPPTLPLPNPSGEVLTLTSSTFASTLGLNQPTFIKFYAPWCGHCKKLAPTWKKLAKHMQGKVVVAEVNCDDFGAVCKGEGVGGYPTLMWYAPGGEGEGRKGMEYGMGRKLEQLKAFAEKASAAGVEVLDKPEDLDKHIAEDEVVYLLLHSEGDDEILSKIRDASSPLLGSPQILSSSSPTLLARYSLTPLPSLSSPKPWALLAFKDHDAIFPTSIFHGSSFSSKDTRSIEEAREWLLTHRIPTTVELTQDTFQSVMNAPQKPMVFLSFSGTETREKVLARLRDVGKKWRLRTRGKGEERNGEEGVYKGREVVFAWMDEGRWGDWVKGMYGAGSVSKAGDEEGKGGALEGVRVVVADHSNLVYYDTDAQSNPIRFTSSASIFAAVEDAVNGKSAYKHSEGLVERVARYLNAKMQAIEHTVTHNPFRSFLVLVGVVGGIFWMLTRVIGSDVRGREDWKEVKGRSGRLD